MIINDNSSIVNKFETSLTDAARVFICDHHVFIVQAHWSNNRTVMTIVNTIVQLLQYSPLVSITAKKVLVGLVPG